MMGRSSDFSPFCIEMMKDDGKMMADDGGMLIDASLSSLLAGSFVPRARSGQSFWQHQHHKLHSSALSFSGWSAPATFGA